MNNRYKPIIPTIVKDLQQSGEHFRLLNSQDGTQNTDWLENNFPITFGGRIDWAKVPSSVCIKYFDDSERLSALEKILADKQLYGDITIAWANALRLPIKTDIKVLKKYAEKIFEEDWDVWICNEQDQWCIENHHDNEICFGKCITTK